MVESGKADVAFLPASLVISPVTNDTNPWVLVTPAISTNKLYDPIVQYAVALGYERNAGDVVMAQAFLTYLIGPVGRAVMTAFGYI
jgi:ABC-type molybdate transport system substrate-binding protein